MTEYRETGWNIDNFSLLKPARNLKLRQFTNVQYCKDRVERQNTIFFFFTHFLYMYSNSKWQILKTFDDQEFGYRTSLHKCGSQAQSIRCLKTNLLSSCSLVWWDGNHLHRPWAILIKLLESEIKFMLKLQIGQILTMSKSDLSGVWAYCQATCMPNLVHFAYTLT